MLVHYSVFKTEDAGSKPAGSTLFVAPTSMTVFSKGSRWDMEFSVKIDGVYHDLKAEDPVEAAVLIRQYCIHLQE